MTKLKCHINFGLELRHGGLRILNSLKKYAPEHIEFTDYESCNFVIMHHQYKHDLDHYLHNCKKPMIFLISELQQTKEYFKEFFANPLLKMTYTFHPLRHFGYVDDNDTTNHVLAPWGYDDSIFNGDIWELSKNKRDNTIISFGFYDSEKYTEIYNSCRITDNKMLHLDIKKWDFLRQGLFFDEKYHSYKEWVSDEELVEMYKSCRFVSGLRSGSGFEVPSIEGAALGCAPICFDNIYYRQFFNDFAIFIPEEFDIDMVNNLSNIFRNADSYRLNAEQIQMVRDRFNWKTVATNFWKEVNASL